MRTSSRPSSADGAPRRRPPGELRALAAWALLLLAACGGGPAPGDPMAVREVVQEPLARPLDDAFRVVAARDDAPPRVGILTPSLSWRVDGGDAPALVMPPPCAVELVVPAGHGPLVLRAAAGVDRSAHGGGERGDVGFRVLVDGREVFSERIPAPRDEKGRDNAWRTAGGERGLLVAPGARVRFETQAEPGAPPVDAGFGRLWLERHSERRRAEAGVDRPNLVLVVMDTLRRDRVSAYGLAGEREVTPRVDALARRGTLFEDAWATSSWTWPSTASLLTGLLPQRHGVLDHDSCYLGNELETLAEALQRAGYTTAGFSGNPLVTGDKNFDQGFETFRAARRFAKSDDVVPEALEWARAHAEVRFFLYLHLVDPHMEYLPSESARAALVGPRPAGFPAGSAGDVIEAWSKRLFAGEGRGPAGYDAGPVVSAENRRHVTELYEGAARTGDEWLGRVLDLLDELELADRTVVAFTSDHGEELFDHGLFEHGHTLHGELVRVPLVLAGPGVAAGARVATRVSNRHLAPTLARLGGVALPAVDDALDLLAPLPDRTLFLSTRHGFVDGWSDQPIHGAVAGEWVLHLAPEAGAFGAAEPAPGGVARLYRLSDDPGERADRAAEEPDRVQELSRAIAERFEREARERVARPIPAGDATIELMKGVGYLGK